jgi:hypothetical protein
VLYKKNTCFCVFIPACTLLEWAQTSQKTFQHANGLPFSLLFFCNGMFCWEGDEIKVWKGSRKGRNRERNDDKTDKCWKWERNTGERRKRDKGMKGIKERKKEGKGWRYRTNHYPLNFNRYFTLLLLILLLQQQQAGWDDEAKHFLYGIWSAS